MTSTSGRFFLAGAIGLSAWSLAFVIYKRKSIVETFKLNDYGGLARRESATVVVCPNCKLRIEPVGKFCPICGYKLNLIRI